MSEVLSVPAAHVASAAAAREPVLRVVGGIIKQLDSNPVSQQTVFIYRLRRGHDGSIWMNQFFDWVNDLFNPDKKKKSRSPKDEFYYKVSGTQPYKKIPNVTQQRIDEILDKINQQGYRFLTDEEKEILKRAADEEDL